MTSHGSRTNKTDAETDQRKTNDPGLDPETLKDLDQDPKRAAAIRGGANYSRVASVAF